VCDAESEGVLVADGVADVLVVMEQLCDALLEPVDVTDIDIDCELVEDGEGVVDELAVIDQLCDALTRAGRRHGYRH